MGIPVRALLREKGTPYAELGLADPKWSDDELIDFMLAHPILINRPIVVTPKGVKLCRPSEAVLDILPNPHIGRFVKEDGEVSTSLKALPVSVANVCAETAERPGSIAARARFGRTIFRFQPVYSIDLKLRCFTPSGASAILRILPQVCL